MQMNIYIYIYIHSQRKRGFDSLALIAWSMPGQITRKGVGRDFARGEVRPSRWRTASPMVDLEHLNGEERAGVGGAGKKFANST